MKKSHQKMGAAVLKEYGKIEWHQVNIPELGDSDVMIKTEFAGLCGSDQHIFKGEFHPRTHLPMIPGHEFSGIIVDWGKNVQGFKEGQRVTVDPILWCGECPACEIGHYPACTSLKLVGVDMNGGFGEFVTVKDFMVHKLPDTIQSKHAALVEVLSIGFHACNRAKLGKNDSVAIWGAGRIGQCILQAARTKTQKAIYVVDILDERLDIAKRLYENVVTINAKKYDPISVIEEHTKGRGIDIAFEAVGHAEKIPNRRDPVAACVQSIRGAGHVCVLGLADEITPLLMKELIWKEAKIIASRVTHGEFKETIHHLSSGHLFPDALISCEMPAHDAQKAFTLLDQNPQDYLKILLTLNRT